MSARGPSRRTRNMRRTCLVFHCTPGSAGAEDLAALCVPLRQEPERNTTMPTLSEIARDERTARMALSMLVESDDAVTGHLLAAVGGVETLRLAESDGPVPGLGDVDARVWRGRFATPGIDSLDERLLQARRSGLGVLVPGDDEWPESLSDLGERAPYVLWTRGASSFLARPLTELVTLTGRTSCNLLWRARGRDSGVRSGRRRADHRCRRCVRHRRRCPSRGARGRWRNHCSPCERS